MTDGSQKKGAQMTLLGATFLGVGSMVGAGIFALLGEAAAIAGSAVWISFALAGVVALLQGYSYARLGMRYPSSGGIVEFMRRGFGDGHMLGISSWILYFTFTIVLAMVAVSFGSYLGALFSDDVSLWTVNLLASLLIVGITAVVLKGAAAVSKSQTLIVSILLLVFAVFILATLTAVNPSLLAPSTYPPFGDIAGSVALTFFAFLGFGVVVFSAGDIPNPKKNLPRAVYASIGISVALYVAISVGVMGVLTVDEVISSGSTALAEAARPVLGQAGFVMMALAALLATASSASANMFAVGGITSMLGRIGQFPPVFGRTGPGGRSAGLVISMLFVIVIIWLFDLSAIASLGSAIGLIVFALVSIAHLRVIDDTGAKPWLIWLGLVAVVAVFVAFVATTLVDEPRTLTTMILLLVASIGLDFGWKAIRAHRRQGADPVDSTG